jgi:hypothetical protein
MKYKLNLSEFDKGWLAAAIDFEGWIYISKSPTKKTTAYQLHVGVKCTNKEIVKEIQKKVGFGMFTKNKYNRDIEKGWKSTYEWKIGAKQALVFLKEIEPYLIVKREQAKLGIQFQEMLSKAKSLYQHKEGLRKPFPKEYWDWKEYCYLKMKELNKRGL